MSCGCSAAGGSPSFCSYVHRPRQQKTPLHPDAAPPPPMLLRPAARRTVGGPVVVVSPRRQRQLPTKRPPPAAPPAAPPRDAPRWPLQNDRRNRISTIAPGAGGRGRTSLRKPRAFCSSTRSYLLLQRAPPGGVSSVRTLEPLSAAAWQAPRQTDSFSGIHCPPAAHLQLNIEFRRACGRGATTVAGHNPTCCHQHLRRTSEVSAACSWAAATRSTRLLRRGETVQPQGGSKRP